MNWHVTDLIRQYGYAGIFFILFMEMVGIPFPAETTLTLAGLEWQRGALAIGPLVAVASLGNFLGSLAAYGIGRWLGGPVVERFGRYVGLTEARMTKTRKWFRRYQSPGVLFGKFIAGIRVLIPYIAGIERMPIAIFALLNAISAIAWVLVFTVFGRLIGVEWARYHAVLHGWIVPGIVLAVLAAGVYTAWKWRRERRGRSEKGSSGKGSSGKGSSGKGSSGKDPEDKNAE